MRHTTRHDAPAYMTADGEFTEAGRHIIALEGKTFRYSGTKEQAISELLNITTTTYYRLLNRMIDDERVEHAEPLLVHRLQPRRETNRRTRRDS